MAVAQNSVCSTKIVMIDVATRAAQVAFDSPNSMTNNIEMAIQPIGRIVAIETDVSVDWLLANLLVDILISEIIVVRIVIRFCVIKAALSECAINICVSDAIQVRF